MKANGKWKSAVLILLLCLASAALGGGAALYWVQQMPVEIPQIEGGPLALEDAENADGVDANGAEGSGADADGAGAAGAAGSSGLSEAGSGDEEDEFSMLEGVPEVDEIAEGAAVMDLTGKLYTTKARKAYKSGSLRLVIPKLELDEGILDGVTGKKLRKGDGLYPYAQLPTDENGNVAIAGHRNGVRNGRPVASRKFYYLNTLTEGDYLYLVYEDTVYQYLWEGTEIVLPTDWTPIRNRGYSCITLTTCTPIGVADHRLVVRGALVDSFPYAEGCEFSASRPPY